MDAKELRKLKKFSAQLRIDQLEMFKQRGMGHIGGCPTGRGVTTW